MKVAAIDTRRGAVADYVSLTKPRLSLFVLIVVFIAGWLASDGRVNLLVILNAVMGTALVAGGANALNMLFERKHDAVMRRTWDRPLPSGRLAPRDVAIFGTLLGVLGVVQLALGTTLLAAGIAAANLLSYLFIYTPLKRVTTLNTHVGAVPGALPALIGWAAVAGSLAPLAWMLFLIVYLWQVPHFLSIAWLYREDYERGGFLMLPVIDKEGVTTGRQAVLGALALIPISLAPVMHQAASTGYLIGALLLGLYFLRNAIAFAMRRDTGRARLLLRASRVYLPCVLALLLLFRV